MAIKDVINQLEDDANVIDYKPKLEYIKERTAKGEAIEGEHEDLDNDEEDEELYTKTLNGFIRNTPSSVLEDIDYVIRNIRRLKNYLANRFNEEQAANNNPFYNNSNTDGLNPSSIGTTPTYPTYPTGNDDNEGSSQSLIITPDPIPGNVRNPYDIGALIDAGENDDANYANDFEEHYNSPAGTVIPALINQLTSLEKQFLELSTNFRRIYYNDVNIPTQEARQRDSDYIKDLKKRERSNDIASINYMTISFDSILNKSVSVSIFKGNKKAIKVAKVIDSHEETIATTNDMDIIKKLFAEVNEELDLRSRGYKRQKDLQLIQKSLYNYYEKRKYLNDLYALREKDKNSVFLGRKVDEYAENLTEAIRDVNRVLQYDQNYLDKITELEKEKYNIQKIYKSTNKNL